MASPQFSELHGIPIEILKLRQRIEAADVIDAGTVAEAELIRRRISSFHDHHRRELLRQRGDLESSLRSVLRVIARIRYLTAIQSSRRPDFEAIIRELEVTAQDLEGHLGTLD